MASRGFEFAYMLDGTEATPVIRDFVLGVAAAHKVGDLMVIASDGYADKVTSTTTEVTGVCMEALAAADITAESTTAKLAIITHNQVWRCSMNASTTAFLVGYTKTIDTVDCNTISATDSTGGKMILVDKSQLDDEGNVLAYVQFSQPTFGAD
jgi:hypothetical protein